jgi:putative transposase
VFVDAAGHWWASSVVQRAAEVFAEASAKIGVDWGVKVTATTTDPAFDLAHGGHGRSAAAKLAGYQRRMARRKPQPGRESSVGYGKAKRDAAKLHIKVTNQRRYHAIGWARRVVTHHALIAVEDFKPTFLARSTMAKKAADATIGAAKATLIEYASRAGRIVVVVPPAYTTMTCSECGARAKRRLGLEERTFRCECCGHSADRDRNAARVILASAELHRASAESVRHDPPSGTRAA